MSKKYWFLLLGIQLALCIIFAYCYFGNAFGQPDFEKKYEIMGGKAKLQSNIAQLAVAGTDIDSLASQCHRVRLYVEGPYQVDCWIDADCNVLTVSSYLHETNGVPAVGMMNNPTIKGSSLKVQREVIKGVEKEVLKGVTYESATSQAEDMLNYIYVLVAPKLWLFFPTLMITIFLYRRHNKRRKIR